jgi:hypothetical protein
MTHRTLPPLDRRSHPLTLASARHKAHSNEHRRLGLATFDGIGYWAILLVEIRQRLYATTENHPLRGSASRPRETKN